MTKNFSIKKQEKQHGAYQNLDSPLSYDPIKKVELLNVDEWKSQIAFYRTHMDIFIEEYFKIKLFDFQKCVAREFGRSNNIILIEPRSIGKTWLMALLVLAFGVLYPNSPIGIMSGNVKQANIIIKRYIDKEFSKNPNIAREIVFPIKIAKDGCLVNLKSGAFIESTALGSTGDGARGNRYKLVLVDEARLVKDKMFGEIIKPMLQYNRPIYYNFMDSGNKDIPSKLVQISSAYLKSCSLYDRFKFNVDRVVEGNENYFTLALHYKTGVRNGIIQQEFVDEEKRGTASSIFSYEWESIFVGNAEGSFFPFDLSEPCRSIQHVEIRQPKNSQSKYIISVDPAISDEKWGDNASIQVIKLHERSNGTYLKELVNIKTFHGFQLEELANEIRKTYIKFPNTIKIVIDINGLGQGIVPLLDTVWVDEEEKEYPPFVPDDDERRMSMPNAVPIIRAVIPSNKSNSSMAVYTKSCLENKSLRLPKPVIELAKDDEEDTKRLTFEEKAIFYETDGLIFEMANIRQRMTPSGNVVYERIEDAIRKDRYTCLCMGMDYIREIEEEYKSSMRSRENCWGIATNF